MPNTNDDSVGNMTPSPQRDRHPLLSKDLAVVGASISKTSLKTNFASHIFATPAVIDEPQSASENIGIPLSEKGKQHQVVSIEGEYRFLYLI